MRLIHQFGIILGFSFVGEFLSWLIPLPIPAAIYGMVLLFLGLVSKVIPQHWVKNSGDFLVSTMPLMFVAPAVGLITCWDILMEYLLPVGLVVVVSTVVTFIVAGVVTQKLLQHEKEDVYAANH